MLLQETTSYRNILQPLSALETWVYRVWLACTTNDASQTFTMRWGFVLKLRLSLNHENTKIKSRKAGIVKSEWFVPSAHTKNSTSSKYDVTTGWETQLWRWAWNEVGLSCIHKKAWDFFLRPSAPSLAPYKRFSTKHRETSSMWFNMKQASSR